MSSLITYTFEYTLNSNIQIVIKAYSKNEAYEAFVIIARYPEDFKLL